MSSKEDTHNPSIRHKNINISQMMKTSCQMKITFCLKIAPCIFWLFNTKPLYTCPQKAWIPLFLPYVHLESNTLQLKDSLANTDPWPASTARSRLISCLDWLVCLPKTHYFYNTAGLCRLLKDFYWIVSSCSAASATRPNTPLTDKW